MICFECPPSQLNYRGFALNFKANKVEWQCIVHICRWFCWIVSVVCADLWILSFSFFGFTELNTTLVHDFITIICNPPKYWLQEVNERKWKACSHCLLTQESDTNPSRQLRGFPRPLSFVGEHTLILIFFARTLYLYLVYMGTSQKTDDVFKSLHILDKAVSQLLL